MATGNRQKIDKLSKQVQKKCPLILMSDIEVNEDCADDFLGSGGYGEVFKGKYKNEVVVVKVIAQHRFTNDQKHQILACKEARSMCEVSHVSIIKIFGLILDDRSKKYGVVLEYMEYGSLLDIVRKGVEIPIGIMVEMMGDISKAMTYLHDDKKLIHADMKLDNIMVNSKLRAKVGDFGISILQGRTSQMTSSQRSQVGTLTHMAPELFNSQLAGLTMVRNSNETDVWSFGVTLYELLLKKTPFDGGCMQNEAIMKQISDGIQHHCEQALRIFEGNILATLAVRCLEYDPKKRPTFSDLYSFLHNEFIEKYKVSHLDDVSMLRGLLESKSSASLEPDYSTISVDEVDLCVQENTNEGRSSLQPSGARAPTTVQPSGTRAPPTTVQPTGTRAPTIAAPSKASVSTAAVVPSGVRSPTTVDNLAHNLGQAQINVSVSVNMQPIQAQVADLQQQMAEMKNTAGAQQVDTQPVILSERQQRLKSQLVLFCEHLMADAIFPYFLQTGVFTSDEVERMEKAPGATSRDKARMLIDLILRRGDEAMDIFCRALRREGQHFLANAIEWDGSLEPDYSTISVDEVDLCVQENTNEGQHFLANAIEWDGSKSPSSKTQ